MSECPLRHSAGIDSYVKVRVKVKVKKFWNNKIFLELKDNSCFKGGSQVVHTCFKVVPCFNGVSKLFQECFNGVSSLFHGIFLDDSMMLLT